MAERDKNCEVVNVLEDGNASIKIEHATDEKITEEPKEDIEAVSEEIRVELQGESLDFADQKPIIENDRVLVPFRVIFEALEAEVSWDGDTKTVTAVKGGSTISITIGENKITKNGEEIEIDVPARIINERALVPIRVISESFENTVSWDGTNRIVEIK